MLEQLDYQKGLQRHKRQNSMQVVNEEPSAMQSYKDAARQGGQLRDMHEEKHN